MKEMTVSGLADRTGTTPDTIRYYERIGLLGEVVRSPAGYRLFDQGAVERIWFIKQAQQFGRGRLNGDQWWTWTDRDARACRPCRWQRPSRAGRREVSSPSHHPLR